MQNQVIKIAAGISSEEDSESMLQDIVTDVEETAKVIFVLLCYHCYKFRISVLFHLFFC